MFTPLTITRAKVQLALLEIVKVGHSGFYSYMIPGFEGEAPRAQATIANEIGEPDTMRQVAEGILSNPAAIAACEEWNALVSPDQDALRYVRQLAAGEMPQ